MTTSTIEKPPFNQKSMPTRMIPISKLDLHLQNPRLLRDANDQNDAMEKMLQTAGDDCMELLRDITKVGALSSSDHPIAVKEGNRYTVLEGNRRLLCLRLWRKPTLINQLGEENRKFARRVTTYISQASTQAPDKISVVIAPSIEEAEEWIDKKHGLNGGGAATVRWDAYQRDRRLSQQNPERPSYGYAFVSFVVEEFPELEPLIATVIDVQYTTLERVFSNSDFRSQLGIQFSSGVVELTSGKAETKDVIEKLLTDLAEKKQTSRTLEKTQNVKEYADTFIELLPKVKGMPFRGKPIQKHFSQENTPKSQGDPDKKPPRKQTSRKKTAPLVIFTAVNFSEFPSRLRDLVSEMSTLNLNTHPEVTAASLRVILDLSFEYFEHETGLSKGKLPIWERAQQIIGFINPENIGSVGQVQTWSPMKELWNRCTSDNMKVIQLGTHSFNMTNLPSEVAGLADRFEPLLVAMNDYLRNTKDS